MSLVAGGGPAAASTDELPPGASDPPFLGSAQQLLYPLETTLTPASLFYVLLRPFPLKRRGRSGVNLCYRCWYGLDRRARSRSVPFPPPSLGLALDCIRQLSLLTFNPSI